MQTPPLELLVLDSLVDDHETVETLELFGAAAPSGLGQVAEADVIAALNELLARGLVEVLEEQPGADVLVRLSSPNRDPASMRRYWFTPTDQGRQVWRDGADVLDAYWRAHPK